SSPSPPRRNGLAGIALDVWTTLSGTAMCAAPSSDWSRSGRDNFYRPPRYAAAGPAERSSLATCAPPPRRPPPEQERPRPGPGRGLGDGGRVGHAELKASVVDRAEVGDAGDEVIAGRAGWPDLVGARGERCRHVGATSARIRDGEQSQPVGSRGQIHAQSSQR